MRLLILISLVIAIIISLAVFFMNSSSQKKTPSSNQLLQPFGSAKEAAPTKIIPPLSIDRLFDSTIENHDTTMVVTGDVIPGRSVNRIVREKNDFLFPFRETADVVKDADITLINLEAPLTKECPTTNEGMTFCGDQRFVDGFTFAGIDVASLANNHTSNYGKEGIDQTIQLLKEKGIKTVGANAFDFITAKDTRFAFLAYNGVVPLDSNLNPIDKDVIASDIAKAREHADVVIVSYHWGAEYERTPVIAPGIASDDPIEIGHFTIDAGADVVVGNHPHWYQGIEIYKDKPIFYALGNFVFDQFWSEETKKGFLAKLYIADNKVVDIELFPIYIDGVQPKFVQGAMKEEILSTVKEESKKLTN